MSPLPHMPSRSHGYNFAFRYENSRANCYLNYCIHFYMSA